MDQIEEVLSKVDIVQLISSYTPLKKAGRNFKALCPFHSEKTPSFIVSPERQIFKCFGCGAGGNAIKFLQEYEKMTFGEALRFLADKVGVKLKRYQPTKEEQIKDRLLAINHLASEYYHFLLTKHKVGQRARQYLKKRGITLASIQLFKLGWAPDNWENLIRYLAIKKGYSRDDLLKTGLIIRGRGFYDRFRDRIVFPLRNHRNEVVGFSGRVLVSDLKGRQGAKYVNTPETSIYHKSELLYGLEVTKKAIKEKNQVIVVEGEFDLISSYQAGVKNIVAVKGSALTIRQIELLKRFCENIVLSMDSDTAGESATKRAIELLDQAGLNIRVLELKTGKDPDDIAQKSASAWRQMVKKTIPVFDFFINSAKKKFDKETPEGKKKISEALIPIILKINNEVIKAHYIKKLANLLGVKEETVIREMERVAKKSQINQKFVKTQPAAKKQVKKKSERLEEMLLSLILQKAAEDKTLVEEINVKQLTTLIVKKIALKLKEFCSKNKFEIRTFVLQLPPELTEIVDRLYLYDWGEVLTDDSKFKKQLSFAKKEIEKTFLRGKINQLAKKIRDEKDKFKLEVFRKEITDLTKKLKNSS